LIGEPGKEAISFVHRIGMDAGAGQGIRRLICLLTEELASPCSFASGIACRSFEDHLLYLLLSLPNNYSGRLARAAASPVPCIVHRAEAYIRSHADQPIALHEIADAADCSVRTLQLGFRQFPSRPLHPA
jgi:hypothetical protein